MVTTMKQKDPTFNVGDLIWVSAQAVKLEGNSKLLPKWFRPFNVMEVHHNSYHLHFLNAICVHSIINISFLKSYIAPLADDPFQQVKASVVHDNVYEVKDM